MYEIDNYLCKIQVSLFVRDTLLNYGKKCIQPSGIT